MHREATTDRILYLDCFSGVSGDMLLGSLIDLGAPLDRIESELNKIALEPFSFDVHQVMRSHIRAAYVTIHPQQSTVVRYWRNIRQAIEESELSPQVKERSLKAFAALAEAEGMIHGKPPEMVHFHEIGAIDTLVDIVGTMSALDSLGIERVIASPIATGVGMIKTDHGSLPIPAPATAELLKGAPIYSGGIPHELTTPTGAALIKTIVDEFGDLPLMTTEAIGYGAGRSDLDQPNVLRAFLGTAIEAEVTAEEKLSVVEANIDDMNPELYPYLVEKIEAAGAVDAWLTHVTMKKGRPGTVLSAMVHPQALAEVIKVLLSESTTLGIRHYEVNRRVLERSVEQVRVQGETISVKIGWIADQPVNFAAEYEEARTAAAHLGLPLKEVMHQAAAEARKSVAARFSSLPRIH